MAIFMDAWLMIFECGKKFLEITGNDPIPNGFFRRQRIEASFPWQVLNCAPGDWPGSHF
jgi:hypothetical protein